jgi:hypothetical protein
MQALCHTTSIDNKHDQDAKLQTPQLVSVRKCLEGTVTSKALRYPSYYEFLFMSKYPKPL